MFHLEFSLADIHSYQTLYGKMKEKIAFNHRGIMKTKNKIPNDQKVTPNRVITYLNE